MNPDRAYEIIQALADGIDPYTGERFPDDSPYQRADTVRALYAALQALASSTDPATRPADNEATVAKPIDPAKPRAGGPWTPEEEQQLRDAFAAKKSFEQIAADHGRSRGAITTRLVKLGLITINDQPCSDRPPPNIPILIKARHFSVVDAQGKQRVALTVTGDGTPGLATFKHIRGSRLPRRNPYHGSLDLNALRTA